MGSYLTPGHTYTDGDTVTGPSLTEHVEEATFKTTAITTQTLKDPVALTDQILIVASGSFFQTTLQQIHNLILYPGSVVQTVYGEYTANTNLPNSIPWDDTVPQNTEGTEIISLSVTPRFATSTILLTVTGQGAISGGTGTIISAIFRGAIPSAIVAGMHDVSISSWGTDINLLYLDSPATTSATTYRLRVGPGLSGGGNLSLNGYNAGRQLGGAMRTVFVAQEIKQ